MASAYASTVVVTFCLLYSALLSVEATRMRPISSVRVNKPLSEAATEQLSRVFELLKSEDWMNQLMREISLRKLETASTNPPAQSENVETQVKRMQDEVEAVRPGHRNIGKLGISWRRRREGDEFVGSRSRVKRSEPEEPNHSQLTATTTAPLSLHINDATTSWTAVHDETSASVSNVESVVSSANEHLESSTKPGFNFTFPPCPAEFNYCVYGECVDLGYSVYVCNCAEGYTGMACEILDLQVALIDLHVIAGSENPAQEASNHPEALSSASAIAQYLAGEVRTFH